MMDLSSAYSVNVSEAVVEQYLYTTFDKAVVAGFMPIIVIFGILGNTATILVLNRGHRLHNTVNIYLINLALADLLFLLIAPDLIFISYLHNAIHDYFDMNVNVFFCKMIYYLSDSAVQCAAFTIVWMSLERYISICRPLLFRRWGFASRNRAIRICIIIWLLVLTFQSRKLFLVTSFVYEFPWPDMYMGLPNTTRICTNCNLFPGYEAQCDAVVWLLIIETTVSFIIVFVIIIIYSILLQTLRNSPFTDSNSTGGRLKLRAEKKVFQTLFITVSVYVICFAPFLTINLIITFSDIQFRTLVGLLNIARVLVYTNSAVNPVIYNATNKIYRQAFAEMFCCREPVLHRKLQTSIMTEETHH
ncbi:neuropeptides capa receptor-like [Anneissia japonica]|uniref:neuropeptides capa receptor-like n=1 Tax=Anneissia japonica TaxID=1529436 RepID=UPI001425512F|nr:neuropeptides capa receptor-like [Anneissia japonica]